METPEENHEVQIPEFINVKCEPEDYEDENLEVDTQICDPVDSYQDFVENVEINQENNDKCAFSIDEALKIQLPQLSDYCTQVLHILPTSETKKRGMSHSIQSTSNCILCNKNVSSSNPITENFNKDTPNSIYFKCKFCSIFCESLNKLGNHILTSHKDMCKTQDIEHSNKKKEFKCEKCSEYFSTQNCFHFHSCERFSAHHKNVYNLPCLYCDVIFKDTSELCMHVRITHHVCRICEKAMSNSKEYDLHENYHDFGLIRFYHCLSCGIEYKTLQDIKFHVYNHHPKIPEDTAYKIYSKKLTNPTLSHYSCAYCDKYFNTVVSLIKHMSQIHQVKRCQCQNHFLHKPVLLNFCLSANKEIENNAIIPNTQISDSSNDQPQQTSNNSLEMSERSRDKDLRYLIDHDYLTNDKTVANSKSNNTECETDNLQVEKEDKFNINGKRFHCQVTVDASNNVIKYQEIPSRSLGIEVTEDDTSEIPSEDDLYCKFCCLEFKSKEEYSSHLTSTVNSKLPCLFCGKIYDDPRSLELHISRLHHACKVCNVTFKEKHMLDSHNIQHQQGLVRVFSCQDCSMEFRERIKLVMHMIDCHNKKNVDEESLKSKPLRVRYEHLICNVKFMCPYCNIFLDSKEILKIHKSCIHGVHKCLKCENHFSSFERINDSLPTICPKCNIDTISQEKVKDGNKGKNQTIPEKIICKICNNEFYSITDLDKHDKIHQKIPNMDAIHYCKNCSDKPYVNYCSSKVHFIRFHERKYLSNPVIIRNGEKMLQCKICLAIFTDQNLFYAHSVPYTYYTYLVNQCVYCDEKFKNVQEFSYHCSEVHNIRRELQCKICKLTFTELHLLTMHVIEKHNINKCFCKNCKKDCDENSFFKEHVENQCIQSKVKRNICPFCIQVVKDIKKFTTHVNSHSYYLNTEFLCKFCLNYFKNEHNIKTHIICRHNIKQSMVESSNDGSLYIKISANKNINASSQEHENNSEESPEASLVNKIKTENQSTYDNPPSGDFETGPEPIEDNYQGYTANSEIVKRSNPMGDNFLESQACEIEANSEVIDDPDEEISVADDIKTENQASYSPVEEEIETMLEQLENDSLASEIKTSLDLIDNNSLESQEYKIEIIEHSVLQNLSD